MDVEPPGLVGSVGGAFRSPVAPDLAKNARPAHHGRQHLPGRIAAEHEAVADLAVIHHLLIVLLPLCKKMHPPPLDHP